MSSHEKELANGSSNDQEDPSATVVMALDKVIVKSGKVNTPERNQIGDQTSTEHAIIQQPEDQDNDSGSDDEEEEEDTAAMMPAEGVDAAYAQHNSPAVEGQESDSMSNDDEGEKSDEEASNTLATKRKGGLGGNWMEEDTASATGSEQDDAEGDTNGNEDGSDSEEEDEEDEEDEEEEPSLKYSRLGPASSEILIKDTASALAASSRYIALGTHNGMVHILTYEGSKINSYRPHGASITDIKIDEESDFVATASMEGRVVIRSSTSPEIYAFDQKRPLRAVALEPNFAKKSTKAFVCGGMAGTLVMYEKGWLGHKETVLHSGEGPIWAIEWRGSLIAWANDKGIKFYDTSSSQRIAYIDRPANSPRADVFKPTLYWEDDKTLLVAWADYIKIARIRERPRPASVTGGVTLTVEITAIFRVDCMISGICPYKSDNAFLVLAYVAPDIFSNEATENPMEQRRKAANRPELRIISRKGEEVSSDALSLSNYHLYGCNDYLLMPSGRPRDEVYLVVSPKDLVVSRPRDQVDHINWLVDQRRFEEALSSAEKLVEQHGESLDIKAIGVKYIKHLFDEGSYEQAARLCPKVFGQDGKIWEDWIFLFIQRGQFPTIIPYVPTKSPRLARLIYDMIMAHFLTHDKEGLLNRIKEWPIEIYDIQAVIVAVQGELDSAPASPILMECLAELYIAQHQPAKALPFLIRLRKPEVFEFISLHNLFSAVQDQVLLLVDFDRENIVDNGDHPIVDREHEKEEMALASTEGHTTARHGQAIALLVEHTYSIPINRVVTQLEERPRYLHMYLDGLFRKDPSLAYEYSDLQVRLYAEYDYSQLMGYLRASNYYSLEKAYEICTGRDFVPEMVFLLGRMGNNKQALMLIIERLGDVQRAIDFAREQADEDLWEDLLRYSESKPAFMRGLLENAGADINPLRIIRRIKDDLEVPGLKDALVKILQASNLQVSLLEGCQKILAGDTSSYASQLQRSQTNGAFATGNSRCLICDDYLFKPGDPDTAPLALAYLCRHMVHASCALPDKTIELPERPDPLANFLYTSDERNRNIGPGRATAKNLGAKLAYSATIRVRVKSCPVCEKSKGSQVRLKAVR